jgi:two-component system sensor histidine kinase UhpB
MILSGGMNPTAGVLMDKSDIEAHSQLPRRWELLWLALYPVTWMALFAGSTIFWFLPAGLRLGTLWLLPRRSWWKMAIVEWAAILALSLFRHAFQSTAGLLASTVLPWCIYAAVLWGMGRHGRGHSSRQSLPRLMATGLLAALFTTIALTAIDLNDDGVLPHGLASTLASYALGDFAGVVLIVPLLLVLRDQLTRDRLPWDVLLAEGLVLAPVVVVMSLSFLPSIRAPIYPLMLALLPLFGLAYKFGWRQSAMALGLLAIGIDFMTGPLIALWGPGQLQVLIALTSCAALLLGISSETQQVQQKVLSKTVETLSLRRSQLAVAANRMAALQEEERRRIGAELHDQIGQDMTAIATRLRVIERKATDHAVRDGLASIGLLVSDAHVHLREVINHLHPAVLDRFGLARALADGPFAEMLRDRDIEYTCTIEGHVDSLPDNVASTVYRICQEAATNCARHGCDQVRIRLALLPGMEGPELTLEIHDSAGRLQLDNQRPGHGLLNIHDRAQAIGADYAFDPDSGEPRHALRLQMADGNADQPD